MNGNYKGVILETSIENAGSGYVDATRIPTIGGNGPQYGILNAQVNITTNMGTVVSVSVYLGGSFYKLDDRLVVSGGNGDCIIRVTKIGSSY